MEQVQLQTMTPCTVDPLSNYPLMEFALFSLAMAVVVLLLAMAYMVFND